MANRPPSSCTIGRSSGGITGTVSSTIHSGRFSDLVKADTTFRRLIARACFWPFEVLIVSRSDAASASRSRDRSSSRIASAPMPPVKNSPNPYELPNRSFSSRNRASSLTISCTSSSLNLTHVRSSRSIESREWSSTSFLRAWMSW